MKVLLSCSILKLTYTSKFITRLCICTILTLRSVSCIISMRIWMGFIEKKIMHQYYRKCVKKNKKICQKIKNRNNGMLKNIKMGKKYKEYFKKKWLNISENRIRTVQTHINHINHIIQSSFCLIHVLYVIL